MEASQIDGLTVEQQHQIHEARSARTVLRHRKEWLENVKANAPLIKNDLSQLWRDEGGIEMISVAAGPSLDEDFDKIESMREGRELIVVDAAYKFCVDRGVCPDWVICTDASPKVLSMWDGMTRTTANLILNVMAHPGVAKWWGEKIWWFVMANLIYDRDEGKLMQDMHAVEAKIGAKLIPGGNVSSVSLGFCLSVRNADKVHLFGHDFCWKDDFYCGGQLKHLENERIGMEGKANTIFETTNTRGEKVLTNLSLKQYAIWHEEALVRMQHRVENHTRSTILKTQGGKKK